jgi:hypothetical protein
MATLVIPGALQITVSVDNPDRDDLGGLLIWMDTTSGFTPGPSNLVYEGPDIFVPVNKDAAGSALVAGTTYYLVLALFSQIDPTDYDLSAEFSATPTAPTANADDITAGTLSGTNVFAGSFGTAGTTLDGAVLAAAATINVRSTADFPASGTAMVFGPTNDRDLFTYTGKTDTSFTGCSGVLAQPDGAVVIPTDRQLMVIDANVNEMRFFGDRGDGVFEELAGIGRRSSGADFVVGQFGSPNFTAGSALFADNNDNNATIDAANDGSGYAVDGESNGGTGIHGGASASGRYGVHGESRHATGGAAVRGESAGTGAGVSGRSVSGPGLEAVVPGGGLVRAQLYLDPNATLPSGTPVDGDVAMVDVGRMYVYDGTAFREVLKVEPSIFANVGTGGTVALTAPPRRYVNTGAAKAALTFDLPASPVNGQTFEIATDNAITTVTVRDSAGVAGNVLNAPTTLAAGGFCKFEYRSSNTTWYRVG